MSLLRQAFITHFMAVRHSQVLSGETSGYITVNCLCARLQWSASISSKVDTVWERSEGIRPPCRERNGSSIYCNKHNFSLSSLLSQWVFIIRPRPFPCWITSVITSPLCSYYKINAETFIFFVLIACLNSSIIFTAVFVSCALLLNLTIKSIRGKRGYSGNRLLLVEAKCQGLE